MARKTPPLTGTDLYRRIGEMLEAGGLEPTTVHYDLLRRHLSGEDPELSRKVEEAISRHGAITPGALKEIPYREGDPHSLTTLAQNAARQIRQIIDLTARSGQNASEYGAVLRGADLREDPASVVATLVSATKTMIRKSDDLEHQIQTAYNEAQSLRKALAEAREHADRDPLTGLANRRALDAALKQAVDNSNVNKADLAVALVDIDHFKRINDQHGHDVGDRVIKYVAGTLRSTQGSPFVGRYGGEEFVLIFRGVDSGEASRRLDAVREKIGRTLLRVEGTGATLGRISFSAGISGPPLRTTSASMMKSADRALYRAKQQGRNQIQIAGAAE
ncbi:GGDEF domain-containing protein [Sphingomonas sp. 3-13AW]|uniref:GGDEF domain-containing protein n=1 Tax=Sphingomonas sp. 3-13AW TaxID=3050450 RepID=UPI003BB4D9AD